MNKKTGIALFVYNRPEHTHQVLEGLKTNNIEHLYVFSDGPKHEIDKEKVEAVRQLFQSIDWCEVELIASPQNKGLANSLVDGINHVLSKRERIIVFEDDCVPAPSCIRFVEQGLDKYENDPKILTVSGYTFPVDIPTDYSYDALFTMRVASLGWGTWRQGWDKFIRDPSYFLRRYRDEDFTQRAINAGRDLKLMLENQSKGKVDSWAVYWALSHIEANAYSAMPKKSLLINIGNDGSGTHMRPTNKYETAMDRTLRREFNFPDTYIPEGDVTNEVGRLIDGGIKGRILRSAKRVLPEILIDVARRVLIKLS